MTTSLRDYPTAGRRALIAAVLLLLTLMAFRGIALLAHDPLLGLGNNFDMVRVQACIDAWPVRDASIPLRTNSWDAPIARYRFVEQHTDHCFPTSEALFAFAAWPALKIASMQSADGSFPLWLLGAVKFAALWIACAASSLSLLRVDAGAAIANALVGALLLADPAVTLYLNGFYAEFAAVLFAYLAVGSIALALLSPRVSRRLAFACAAFVVLACASKLQHVAFGAFVLGIAIAARAWSTHPLPRRLLVALAIAATIGGGLQLWNLQRSDNDSIRAANLTNTVLHAVLAQSDDPARTARQLGLPADCGAHAGKSWFTPGLQERHPCPELLQISRLRLIALAAVEPATFAAVIAGGIERTRPWIPYLLGKVAGREFGQLPHDFFSWSGVFEEIPLRFYAALFALPPLLMLYLLLARRRLPPHAAFVLLFCAAFPWLLLPTVVFGDGYADVAKQFHLGTSAMLAFWLLLATWAAQRVVQSAGSAGLSFARNGRSVSR